MIEKDGAFECYILSVPDTFVGFHKRVRMPAGSDFEPDEESWSVTDQIPYAEKDYLDVGSPESIGRVLRVTHSDASSVGDITGLIPPFYTEKLLKKGGSYERHGLRGLAVGVRQIGADMGGHEVDDFLDLEIGRQGGGEDLSH